ncbi:MAG: putative toxin-antitoxin system toxin component, PIN family [Candidatus Latescibacteria bacterium]|jgi:putative PIN family toxin of toxin-antitoxin system|nr:putative toxin-antitoxin system toxin component, PIN family [Candidatus Latescibacterota bacterium]
MNNSACYVFDTNVIVSALIFEHSKPGRAFRRALQIGQVLFSLPVLEEVSEVVSREKFVQYVTAEEREEFLEALVARGKFVDPAEQIEVCRDPKDDKFLELAVEGNAHFIVSGDDDLLTLNPFRGIEILTVDDFLTRVGEL